MKKEKYTDEEIFEKARQYSSTSELREKDNPLYTLLQKRKLLSKCDWLEKKIRKSLTDDELIEMAKQYQTVGELRKKDNSLSSILYKRNLMSKCDWLTKKKNNYTDEEIIVTARKYEYLNDFMNENYNMWQAAWNRKLDLSFLKKMVTEWSVETALEEASKYETISKFRKYGKGAAGYLEKRGMLDKCKFKKVINPYTDELENYVYAYFFNELKAVYVGRTCYLITRDWEHRKRTNDSVYKFAKKNNAEIPDYTIIERGLSLEESAIKEGEWLDRFVEEGWEKINKTKTGSIGGMGKKYSKKDVFEKARKFEYTKDFSEAFPLEYSAANRRGWLKEMTWLKIKGTNIPSHLLKKGYCIYDDKEKCFEMLKGKTKKECYKNKKLVPWYRAANRNGWALEIFGYGKVERKKKVA